MTEEGKDGGLKAKMEAHPLWPDYQETLEIIREVRPGAENGSEPLNNRLDILEDRLSDLTDRMGRDLGIPDSRRGDPLWQKWDGLWKDLRQARRENKPEDEKAVWSALKETKEKIDMRDQFSKN